MYVRGLYLLCYAKTQPFLCGLRKQEKGPNNASAATTTQSSRPSSSSSCKPSFPFSSLAFSCNLLSSSAIPSQVLVLHYSEFLFFLLQYI